MNKGKYKIYFFCVLLSLLCAIQLNSFAQQVATNIKVYNLVVHYKDSVIGSQPIGIKTSFTNNQLLYDYVNNLSKYLSTKGYPTASVDSVWQEGIAMHIDLYLGTKYNWVQLKVNPLDKAALAKAGYTDKNFANKPFNFYEIDVLKERLLTIFENEGYPFATIYLDSITIFDDKISAALIIDKVLLYKIDSIKNFGKLKLNTKFLQRYLGINNGSSYSREKLKDVDRKMLELSFAETIQSSYLNMLGSGATLNLHVNNKKSSEASAIFGFLPDANATGKFQLTGDVNFDLKNVFGAGEGLLFKYQSLQPKSPRLNIGFDKPYVFQSPFGFNFLFELFKKDSSFLQINAQIGLQLSLSNYQSGKILLQWQNSNLLQGGIDTASIILQKKLPNIIDVKATNVGITYEYSKTNYKFNPLNGSELALTALVGIKNIKKNNEIISLKTIGYNYASLYDSIILRSYQFRLKFLAAHYFQLSKTSTVKASVNAGIYNSPTIFRNEVFQIGGFKTLRGFDEESIYATQYAVLASEYRSLLSLNSYIYGFVDLGITKTKYQSVNANNFFVGAGLGIVYETKAGLLNLSYAIGKRNDVPFGLRQASKIHFGYINYF